MLNLLRLKELRGVCWGAIHTLNIHQTYTFGDVLCLILGFLTYSTVENPSINTGCQSFLSCLTFILQQAYRSSMVRTSVFILYISYLVYVWCRFGVCLAPQHTPLNSLSLSRLSIKGVWVYVCLRFFSYKKCENSKKHGQLHKIFLFSEYKNFHILYWQGYCSIYKYQKTQPHIKCGCDIRNYSKNSRYFIFC